MANKLAYYLRLTPAKIVNVRQDQVAELIGPEQAVDLCLFCIKKVETRTSRVGPRSAIPANKRVLEGHLAQYDRAALLKAIEEAQGADFQAIDPEQKPKFTAAPNPMKTPAAHVKKLQDRGFLPS